jgi:hypothetical protein
MKRYNLIIKYKKNCSYNGALIDLIKKHEYSWRPCTYKFRSAAFSNENIIHSFAKQATPNEEVNSYEPFPSVSVPVADFIKTLGSLFVTLEA